LGTVLRAGRLGRVVLLRDAQHSSLRIQKPDFGVDSRARGVFFCLIFKLKKLARVCLASRTVGCHRKSRAPPSVVFYSSQKKRRWRVVSLGGLEASVVSDFLPLHSS
jgi:hypothetical protein